MKKPIAEVQVIALDYTECNAYIEWKYKIKTRDYAGKYEGQSPDITRPYRDFWHWLVETTGLKNDSDFVVFADIVPPEPWQQTILALSREEFANDEGDMH